jgi:hypothetical protein
MIDDTPLANAVHIAEEARRISIITTIESACPSASKSAGEKHVSRFFFCIITNILFHNLISVNPRNLPAGRQVSGNNFFIARRLRGLSQI